MIRCEEPIRHFAHNKKEFAVIVKKWDAVLEVHDILKILFNTTKQLQRAEMTLSDFYGCWCIAKIKLSKFSQKYTNFAEKLVDSLKERQHLLFQNEAMYCSLYLDPRYKSELSANESEVARERLVNYWMKLKQDNEKIIANESDDFEEYFVGKGLERVIINSKAIDTTEPNYSKSKNEFVNIMNQFDQTPRMHHSESILAFWESQKTVFPELYVVANIINSIPPSQTTVERTFSALGFVYNHKRCLLKQLMLEDLLTIHLNSDLLEVVFENDRKKIEKDVAPK